jgi:hypothetical protein
MRVRPHPHSPRIGALTPLVAASLPRNTQLLSVMLDEASGAGCPCPVLHHRQTPRGACRDPRLGRLGTAVANPSPPPAEQHCPQLGTYIDAGLPHPSRGGVDLTCRDGSRAVDVTGGKPVGRTSRGPGCPLSRGRAASITDLLAFVVLPAVTGIRPSGSEADRDSPPRTANSAGFGHGRCWSASPGCLPRRRSGPATHRMPQ